MFRNTLGAVLAAALIITAGCAGSVTSGPTTTGGTDPTTADSTDGTSSGGETGTVAFYVSDEPNAIDDFEHLNVTITKVGLHRTGNASEDANETNDSATATPTATATPDDESDDADDADDSDDADDGEGEWVEYEVDRRTVDLTELTGANATRLDVLEAPAGTYDKVFIYVDDIDATLTTGEEVRVKLPSERLHVNREFTVGDGEAVDFVFDVSPHRAGKSGKYILKPVVSQSGTGEEVEIRETDERRDDALRAEFVGPVERGSNATVKVTGPDGPVANATVRVGDDVVGTTAADGTLSFRVPEGIEELEVTVTADGAEAELEAEFEDRTETEGAEADETEDGGGGQGQGNQTRRGDA